MDRLFACARECFARQKDFVMVTILDSRGSAPRKAGARMLVCGDGTCAGTVGGGNVEYQASKIALDVLRTRECVTREFDLGPSEMSKLGMVCGGRVTLSFVYTKGTDAVVRERMEEEYRAYLAGKSTVYVFGGGHVSQAAVPVLASVGFRCVVADDRPEFADEALFPDAVEVHCIDFKHIEEKIRITERDYVVVMTRGHEHDYEVQAHALGRKPCYLGVMGSRHKIAFVTKRLLEDGFSLEEIQGCHMPIGLDIKAETPEEIAVSIAAELIAWRAGERGDEK